MSQSGFQTWVISSCLRLLSGGDNRSEPSLPALVQMFVTGTESGLTDTATKRDDISKQDKALLNEMAG